MWMDGDIVRINILCGSIYLAVGLIVPLNDPSRARRHPSVKSTSSQDSCLLTVTGRSVTLPFSSADPPHPVRPVPLCVGGPGLGVDGLLLLAQAGSGETRGLNRGQMSRDMVKHLLCAVQCRVHSLMPLLNELQNYPSSNERASDPYLPHLHPTFHTLFIHSPCRTLSLPSSATRSASCWHPTAPRSPHW